jgi:bacillithiol biosynthesis cysteine-adding enzyme BshC
MNCTQRSGSRYRPYNALITAFVEEPESLSAWLKFSPDMQGIEQSLAQRKVMHQDTATLGRVLQRQYDGLTVSKDVEGNLDAIAASKAFTVTTGHQLCLLGGPAYFIYKILSTISLARAISAQFPDETIVPVFWLASEDHDAEEISHCTFHGRKLEWKTEQKGAVGRFQTEGIGLFLEEAWTSLKNAGADEHVKEVFARAYNRETLAAATREWVNAWLGETGLVIVDADDQELKSQFKGIMLDEVLNSRTVKLVNETSGQLQRDGFTSQVNPREVNLFYLTESTRVRIERDAQGLSTVDQAKRWTEEEISAEINANPERFSPNVLLRPLYQERILPNLAYVGGPGEIAYWLQLRSTCEAHGLHFPVLLLRDSALMITNAMSRKMTKLGLSADDLFEEKDVVLSRLIDFDEHVLDDERMQLEALYQRVSEKLSAVDPTLTAAAGGEAKRALDGLENLKSKLKKAIKTKQEIKVNQLNALWNEVFPEGQPQDRVDNFFHLAAGMEREVIDQLLAVFNPLQNKLTIIQDELFAAV